MAEPVVEADITTEGGEHIDGNYILFHADDANNFEFELFGVTLNLKQKPSARDLGHGAVVWEASVRPTPMD